MSYMLLIIISLHAGVVSEQIYFDDEKTCEAVRDVIKYDFKHNYKTVECVLV